MKWIDGLCGSDVAVQLMFFDKIGLMWETNLPKMENIYIKQVNDMKNQGIIYSVLQMTLQ